MDILDSTAGIGTHFSFQQFREGELIDAWEADNLVPNEGLNSILDVVLNAGAQITSWYVGLFSNNHTPVAGDTGATIDGAAIVEVTAYTGNRPLIAYDAPSGQAIANSVTADVTFTGTATIRGGFIVPTATKGTTGGANGVLISCVNLGADRVVQTGDIVKISVSTTASST
jgi:hypothetical protein